MYNMDDAVNTMFICTMMPAVLWLPPEPSVAPAAVIEYVPVVGTVNFWIPACTEKSNEFVTHDTDEYADWHCANVGPFMPVAPAFVNVYVVKLYKGGDDKLNDNGSTETLPYALLTSTTTFELVDKAVGMTEMIPLLDMDIPAGHVQVLERANVTDRLYDAFDR